MKAGQELGLKGLSMLFRASMQGFTAQVCGALQVGYAELFRPSIRSFLGRVNDEGSSTASFNSIVTCYMRACSVLQLEG